MAHISYSPDRPEFDILSQILERPVHPPPDAESGYQLLRELVQEAANTKPFALTLFLARRAISQAFSNNPKSAQVSIGPHGLPVGSPNGCALLAELTAFLLTGFSDKQDHVYPSKWVAWNPAASGLVNYIGTWIKRGIQNSRIDGILSSIVRPIVSSSLDPSGRRIQRWHFPSTVSLDHLEDNGVALSTQGFVRQVESSTTQDDEPDGLEEPAFEEVNVDSFTDPDPEVMEDVDATSDDTNQTQTAPTEPSQTLPPRNAVAFIPSDSPQLIFPLVELLFTVTTNPRKTLKTPPTPTAQLHQYHCVQSFRGRWVRRHDPSLIDSPRRPEFSLLAHLTGPPAPNIDERFAQLEKTKHLLLISLYRAAKDTQIIESFAAHGLSAQEAVNWFRSVIEEWQPQCQLFTAHLLDSIRRRVEERQDMDEEHSPTMS